MCGCTPVTFFKLSTNRLKEAMKCQKCRKDITAPFAENVRCAFCLDCMSCVSCLRCGNDVDDLVRVQGENATQLLCVPCYSGEQPSALSRWNDAKMEWEEFQGNCCICGEPTKTGNQHKGCVQSHNKAQCDECIEDPSLQLLFGHKSVSTKQAFEEWKKRHKNALRLICIDGLRKKDAENLLVSLECPRLQKNRINEQKKRLYIAKRHLSAE